MRSYLFIIRALSAVGLLVACLAGPVSATPESDFELRRGQERKNYDTMIGNMPLLDVYRMSDVLEMKVENRQIVLRTPLATTVAEGYMRMKYADASSAALVRVEGGVLAARAAPVVPKTFQFTLTDYTTPLEITTLSVNTQPAYCNVSKAWQLPGGGYRNVILLQQDPGSSGDSVVQLTVNESGRDAATPIAREWQAPDFFTLVHAHSHECDQYLRPLMRELGQEGIFAPDPLVAWQIFPELWKPNPSATRAVQDLLPMLDRDDFRARLRASRELDKLGRQGAAVLIHLDREKLTPEQNARIDLALIPYTQLRPSESLRLRSDPLFLLDCLYSDDAALRKVALNRLREAADPMILFDLDAPPAARATAILLLRQKLVPQK